MKKILFETHHLYYLPNFIPIIEALRSKGGYDIYVSIPQYMQERERELCYGACSSMGIQVINADLEATRVEEIKSANFDVIVVGNVGQLRKIVSESTIAVMVYHGIGLKQSYYNDIDQRIDIRAVESEARYNKLKDQGHQNLALTGYTKLDPLFSYNDQEKNNTKAKLGINNDLPTLLYAPTFYPTSFDKLATEFEFLSTEFNVIIKLHNFSWFQSRYTYQSILAKEIASRSENVYLLDNSVYNIIPYYMISDVLISDISSTIFEFLPLDRPIIQAECLSLRMRHRIFKRRFLKKLDIPRMQELDFVYKVENPSELFRSVSFACDCPEEMSELRQEAHDYFFYKRDGNASVRLINKIEKRF
jgi:CDP-glycerol glycerophosphotransferase (TagB/SpsB family)